MTPESTQGKVPPTYSHITSAAVEEVSLDADAHVKQGPTGRGGIQDLHDIGPGDTREKATVNKRADELSSQQTSKPIKGGRSIPQGISSNESTQPAPTGPVEETTLGEQKTRTVPHGVTPDNNGKEGVKSSPGDPTGILPTTQGIAPFATTKLPDPSDKMSAQSQELPSSHTRKEMTRTVETSQARTTTPIEEPAPYAPGTDKGRSSILPPKEGTASSGTKKPSLTEQVLSGGPSTDKLAEPVGVNTRAPHGTTPKTPADPSTIVTSDGQPEKRSTKGEMMPESTQGKVPPTDSHITSAEVEEVSLDAHAHVKQGTTGRGGILDVHDIGPGDKTEKTTVNKRAEELSSQQTSEPIKGGSSTLQGITSNESTKPAPTGAVEETALGEQKIRTVPHGGTPDSNGKEGVKTSPGDPTGILPTTQGIAPFATTKRPAPSDKMSAQSQELPSNNEMTRTTKTSQTSKTATFEKPGGQVSQMKSKEDVNEQDDPSGAKLVENRMKQGDGIAQNAKNGKRNEEDNISSANDNNNKKVQAETIDAPSKLKMQSGKEKSETSKEGEMGINETANSRDLETYREVKTSYPKNSTGQQQVQEIRSTISIEENVKKSTNAPPPQYGTEQQNKYDSPTEEDTDNKTSSDTQQEKQQ